MRQDQQIDELLSAYLDGELSPEENEQLKLKINSSLELQKKLEDISKLKEIVSNNYPKISESPYFETRLFAELKSRNPWYRNALKWSPAVGLALATIMLMVVLKFNPQIINDLIDQQTSNITGFYKENLQPLLFAADLNNEDIFNFAMYKQLPLNREDNQILHLGYDTTGREFFEIKDANKNLGENNYKKFVTALNLSEIQKLQIDSIINQYAEELEAQILVNINNTVAINSNLWNYQRAIQTDLLAFAETLNEHQFRKIMPRIGSVSKSPRVINAANKLRKTKNKNYIILTPDSIFAEAIDFEPEVHVHDIELQLEEYEKETNIRKKIMEEIKINFRYDSSWKSLDNKLSWKNRLNIMIDSNSCRVDISELHIPDIKIQDFDRLFSSFDSIAHDFRFYSQDIPNIHYFDNKIKIDFSNDSIKSYEFKVYDFDMDSLMDAQSEMFDSLEKYKFHNYFNFNDSLVFKGFPKIDSYFKYFNNDDDRDLQMEELNKELEKFKKEMDEWRIQFEDRNSSRKKDTKYN